MTAPSWYTEQRAGAGRKCGSARSLTAASGSWCRAANGCSAGPAGRLTALTSPISASEPARAALRPTRQSPCSPSTAVRSACSRVPARTRSCRRTGPRTARCCSAGAPRARRGASATCLLDVRDSDVPDATMRVVAADPSRNFFEQRFSPNQRWISFISVSATDAGVSTVWVMPSSWRSVAGGHRWPGGRRQAALGSRRADALLRVAP